MRPFVEISRTVKGVKKVLMGGVFAAVLATLIGFQATGLAAQGQRLWWVVIHFEYQDVRRRVLVCRSALLV